MAIQYPGIGYLRGYDGKISDILGSFNEGEAAGKAQRFEEDAPNQFASTLPGLSEYGLQGSPDELRAMFANPNTRALAIAQAQEASQRRADAMDPAKQLALKKAQYEVDHLGDGPGPTAEMRNFQYSQNNPAFLDFINAKGASKAPADVQEYLWYRDNETAAGRQPLSYLEFGQAQKGNGFSVTTNPDGTVSVQQGGSGMPKLNEGQSKDVVYLTKGAGALPKIDEYGDNLTNFAQTVGGKAPLIGNYLKSEEYQQAEQAGKEFLAAVLRKDTGAAVTPSEEEMYGTMYLPRPGDKPAVLTQKKDARARALKAIELGIPPAAILEMEKQGVQLPGGDAAAVGGTQQFPGAPEVGYVEDGYRYKGGDPGAQGSWEKVQ